MDEAIFTHGSKWALHPAHKSTLKLADKRCEFGEMTTAEAARQRSGRIAVLPLMGPLSLRGWYWGGTSTVAFGRLFDQMIADRTVDSIIIEIDSPGGTAAGTEELASKILAARERKPVVAYVNGTMASAAFWIGSAATEIYASPSSEIGSVGVYAIHVDESIANKQFGFNVTVISAGRYKTEMHPFSPLTDEAKAFLQADVDETYRRFIAALARGRGKSRHHVATQFGEGRVFSASLANAAGMIDGIKTFDAVLDAVRSNTSSRKTSATVAHLRAKRLAREMAR